MHGRQEASPGFRIRGRVRGGRPEIHGGHNPEASAGQQGLKIAGVERLAQKAHPGPQLIGRDPALAESNLLQAGDLQALAAFDDIDELGGVDQGVVVEPLLRQVEHGTPEFIEAKRLLAFLEWFLPIEAEMIPENSIVREFIGGSILKDFTIWKHK